MFISYHAQGRLGNNIFQYIAVKVVQKYVRELGTECEYVYNQRSTFFTEFNFKQLYMLLKECILNKKDMIYINGFLNRDWFFDGFYQFDYHILENRDYIGSLFTLENTERINDNYRVCDIVEAVNKYKLTFPDDSVVTHVRLDDFSNIVDFNSLKYILNPFKNVYIVVDKLKKDWERKYMDEFKDMVKHKNVNIINNDDMFKDLAYLWFAPNLVCNNSTFCWVAGILGDCKNSWCPRNLNHHPPQSFERVKDDTVIFDWNTYQKRP